MTKVKTKIFEHSYHEGFHKAFWDKESSAIIDRIEEGKVVLVRMCKIASEEKEKITLIVVKWNVKTDEKPDLKAKGFEELDYCREEDICFTVYIKRG